MDNSIKGVYQHFKGGHYYVKGMAKSTDDSGKEYVLYESMVDGQWYVREKSEFFGTVLSKKKVYDDGENTAWYDVKIPRFTKLY